MSKFAIVFPGQGSQAVGMLADLGEQYEIVKQTFAQASEALGYDLWALVQNGPAEDLNQTFPYSTCIAGFVGSDLASVARIRSCSTRKLGRP